MLSHQADHDPLTGIINRGAFNRLVEIHKSDPNPLALLMIDLDNFKQINDGYGHQVGDSILQKVANLQPQRPFSFTSYSAISAFLYNSSENPFSENAAPTLREIFGSPSSGFFSTIFIISILFRGSVLWENAEELGWTKAVWGYWQGE